MSGYRWHCSDKSCEWTGDDGPAVLAHHQETGHIGSRPVFERAESVPPPATPPPLFQQVCARPGCSRYAAAGYDHCHPHVAEVAR